jgi:hypothetical protein
MPADTTYELSDVKVDASILADMDDEPETASTAEYEFCDGDQDSPYIVLSSLR